MSEGAAHIIQRLQRELMLEKAQCQHWQTQAERARKALQEIVDIYKTPTNMWMDREIRVGTIARSAVNGPNGP